ncbi:Hypothetical predicted protein [Pelobates cultripes]|uniref:Uncharacterized protein n=1 Tax=Pelobates cultripes TaxID=61616 RepID=A0AAD1T8Q7_PELCU|nr:Hypothetical predicted protein [Pelobates cultripes]
MGGPRARYLRQGLPLPIHMAAKTCETLPTPDSPTNTIKIWDKVTHKCSLTTHPSPLTPLLLNIQFTLGMTPRECVRFEDNNLTCLHHFFKNQQIIPFTDLPQMTPFRTFDLFRHIQIKSFLETSANEHVSTTALRPFEKQCMQAPVQKGQISARYSHIIQNIKEVAFKYVTAWERDLDLAENPSYWAEIWEATATISICVNHKEQDINEMVPPAPPPLPPFPSPPPPPPIPGLKTQPSPPTGKRPRSARHPPHNKRLTHHQ